MNGALVGVGAQVILNLKPRLYWEAIRAQHAVGPAKAGGAIQTEVYETTSQASTAKWLTWNDSKQLTFMTDGIDTAAGKEKCLGSVGAFYASNTNYHGSYTTSKYNYAVVSPTSASQLTESGSEFPSIARDPDIATSRYAIYLDTSLDAVNDCVVERSQSRSATYARTFQLFVRSGDQTDPTGIIELGFNETAGTRTTEAVHVRQISDDGWYAVSIIVPSSGGGATAGYVSIKAVADTGSWEIAFPMFYGNYSSTERIVRAGMSNTSATREKYAVRTVSEEVCLSPSGWLAMSVVLPDRSVSNGYVDNSGTGDYGFRGLLNLDCGTWRLRVSMSNTYDHLVVTLGDTSSVNFAYLDCPSDWNDFQAMGIVATWYHANKSKYASLWVNGTLLDSIANPATWFPAYGPPGTMYIGISEVDGTLAESFISRVAYGTNRLHRTNARALSAHMRNMARGATL